MNTKAPWELVLDTFLANWKDKKEVIGVIVCGSFVTGNPSSHSDIDLHLILLEEVYDARGSEFAFVYALALEHLFKKYLTFLRYTKIAPHKIKRFLTIPQDQKKYCLSPFPDQEFTKMFLSALELKQPPEMMDAYKKLTLHVLSAMGGFEINGWKIRTANEF